MPSANYRRNRRMRKSQAQTMEKSDLPCSRNSVPLTVAVDNHLINSKKCPDLGSCKSNNFRNLDNCSVCNGKQCESVFKVGYCGCKFGYYCFEANFMVECPTCPYKDPNYAIDRFSRNVAEGMVEVGELASLALEDLAKSASNFITSRPSESAETFMYSNTSPFDILPRPTNQQERDTVIRNMEIAKAVVGTTATLTGYFANGVGSCLFALGSVLSPVVRGVSKKILSEWNVDEDRAERMVNGGMEIAKAAIITTGSVARGVQNGTGILASGVCSRLVRNYESTYGFQHGELGSPVGDIAKSVVHTAWNVKAIQPRSKLTKISRIYPSPESENRA